MVTAPSMSSKNCSIIVWYLCAKVRIIIENWFSSHNILVPLQSIISKMDKLSSQQRHNNMAAIRSKDTKPEMIVRRGLWKRGFRYRLNHKRLPGHPDLVLRKYRTCIFVNGCFWHGHYVALPQIDNGELIVENSACCKIPKTNREFWVAKIRRNKERDREEQKRLAQMGWHCITVWECELTPKKREETLESIAFTLNHIYLQDHSVAKPYEIQVEESGMLMAAEDIQEQ